MCETSNMPTPVRTALYSSMMPLYCTGISNPANSTMRAPSARCAANCVNVSLGQLDAVTAARPRAQQARCEPEHLLRQKAFEPPHPASFAVRQDVQSSGRRSIERHAGDVPGGQLGVVHHPVEEC